MTLWQLLFRFGVGRVLIFLSIVATALYFVTVNNTALREAAQTYFNGALLTIALVVIALFVKRFR